MADDLLKKDLITHKIYSSLVMTIPDKPNSKNQKYVTKK